MSEYITREEILELMSKHGVDESDTIGADDIIINMSNKSLNEHIKDVHAAKELIAKLDKLIKENDNILERNISDEGINLAPILFGIDNHKRILKAMVMLDEATNLYIERKYGQEEIKITKQFIEEGLV